MNKRLLILSLLPFLCSIMFILILILSPGLYVTFNIAFLLFWSFVGFKSYRYTESNKTALINAHLPSLIILLIILFRQIVLKQDSILQNLFLPVIDISAKIYSLILVFIPEVYSWLAYIIGFILMIASYNLGFNWNKLKCK